MNLGSEHTNGMFLNGSLHWLVYSQDTRRFLVIAFDLLEKTLSEIPLSPELASTVLSYHLRVLGGCLSLCYTGSTRDKAEIWVMKEYKVQSSWTKAFVITDCDIPCIHFHPIHFIEGGGVVGTDGIERLMKFNAEGKLLEHHKYREEYENVQNYFAMYRESLLSFPGETSLPREEATEDVEATVDEEEEATDDEEVESKEESNEDEEATDDEQVESEEESNEDEEATEHEEEESTEDDYI